MLPHKIFKVIFRYMNATQELTNYKFIKFTHILIGFPIYIVYNIHPYTSLWNNKPFSTFSLSSSPSYSSSTSSQKLTKQKQITSFHQVHGAFPSLATYIFSTSTSLTIPFSTSQTNMALLCSSNFGSIPTIVVSSRNIAEKIFTNHEATFFNRPILTAITKLLYNNSGFSFTPNIDQWRQAPKISITELFSPARVLSFERLREEEVKKLVAVIKDLSSVNLSELILSFAKNVVCRATLGDEFGDGGYGVEGVWLHQLILEMRNLIGGFCVADYFPWMKWVDGLIGFDGRLEKTFMKMDKFFDRVIGGHLRKGGEEEESNCSNKDGGEKEKDLLQVLLRLHLSERLHGGFLSNIDHVKAMLVVS